MAYRKLAISDPRLLIYGSAQLPVHCGFDLTIGGGVVFPEVNFTLPPIEVTHANWSEVITQYGEMAAAILNRAVSLQVPGIVFEFELLPAMTANPEWGAEITALLHRCLAEAHARQGLRSALRVTPTDIRDQERPPVLRRGAPWENLRRSFDLCIQAGADIVSIESVGGKEVHDDALMYADLRGIVFALGVLAPIDMAWLWDEISALCGRSRTVPGGDTACGFANTAMQLAHQRMLPEVLVTVVRAMSAVRSLAAFEHGARGPSKDCAYEGPVLKAITGCPISMEGKSASCAHFSPVGNVAAAMCDLWSNESVQNVRLLSGSAPEAFTELLAYDCRLMNVAAARGEALRMRDWLAESDHSFSQQAAALSPTATLRIAEAIVSADSHYHRAIAAGQAAIKHLRDSMRSGTLVLSRKESQWLDRIEKEIAGLPDSEEELWQEMLQNRGSMFDPASYGRQAASSVMGSNSAATAPAGSSMTQ
jgi:methanol--5-hydroxybenzimidazolylcobamide Co-methyltransferase